MAIASTSHGHNVQPPPGPAEAPVRTTASELTDEQRGWLSEASRSDINGWLHVTIKQPWTHVEPDSTGGP
jgi:hypothetical protein